MEKIEKLTWPTITLHWLVGVMFLGVFVLGFLMVDMPAPDKFEWYDLHKSLGVLILMVAVPRLLWRLKEGGLKPVSQSSLGINLLAKLIQWGLLFSTLAMPLSGLAMSIGSGRTVSIFGVEVIAEGAEIPWLEELASTIHHMAVELIIVALALHIIGAIKHQLVDKDRTLIRMLGK